MAGVVLAPSAVTVVPGGDAACAVTIRNTSAVVESYSVTVLGDAAAWATPTPATISLFPGTDGVCNVHFRPPRNASVLASTIDFAVRVAAVQNSDDTVVEEGTVTVAPFVELIARITPRTSEAKRRAKHIVSVDNRGNTPVALTVAASDPDESLAFETVPPTLTIDPGDEGAVAVKVAARSGMLRGPVQHRPFHVTLTPTADVVHPPVVLDAALMQKAGMPRFVPVIAAAAVILVLAAVLLPALTKGREGGGGLFSLTGASGTTSTTPAAAGEGDAEAEAEAEVEAAASGGREGGGGDDGGSTNTDSDDAVSTASGGVLATTTTTAPTINDDDSTATTAAAQAVTTTTTSTTTTMPPTTTTLATYQKFVASWMSPSGSVCLRITTDDTYMYVSAITSSATYSSKGTVADANDGAWSVTFQDIGTKQAYSRVSSSSMAVTTSYSWTTSTNTETYSKVKC